MSTFSDFDGNLVDSIPVTLSTAISGENSNDNRLYGGNRPASKTAKAANSIVKSGSGLYYGWKCTVGTSAGSITIYDNTTGSGSILDVIPASQAAGAHGILPTPIPADTGIYALFGATTGTIVFLYT